MNALLHPLIPFFVVFIHKERPVGSLEGPLLACMRKQTCAVPGLDRGGCDMHHSRLLLRAAWLADSLSYCPLSPF